MEIAYNRRGGYPHQQEMSYTRSPLTKAATMGFSYAPSSPYHPAASQPHAPPTRSFVNDGYSSLPRPKRNAGQPAPRRKAVNSALQGYFKSLNSMARCIVLEKETVEREHECSWRTMDDAAKEEAVNDHFIPQDIRIQYTFDFPIDRSVSRSSYCSMPSGWPSRPHSAHSMNDSMFVDGSSLHLSQPSDWDTEYGHRRRLGSSQEELAHREHTLVHSSHSLSLSQPSLSYSYDNVEATPTPTFNRLHKQQLSFRPSRKQHAIKKTTSIVSSQPPRLPLPRNSLGSDGESPRTTSDEDFEIRSKPYIPPDSQLGFQRSKLRSYSMRSKRTPGTNRSASSTRGSMRTPRRKTTSPDNNRKNYPSTDSPSRPSHYHTYSNTSTDTDYDAEIDLPEPSLLLDHLQSPTEKQADSRLHRRNSRTRRSLKSTPKLVVNTPSPPGTLTRVSTLDSSTDDLDNDIDESILDEPLIRADTPDSLRAATPSSKSYLQSDDDALSTTTSELSRMTPDSMVSCGSFRPKNKQAELAVLRNRRGKWGGSSYRHVTSNFADRHTQFKPNMLHSASGSTQTSASTTRAPSPIDPTEHAHDLLKPPPRFSKYDSVTESITSDLPHSPDQLLSPPATPSIPGGTYLFSDKRESGYISSSSESFQIGARR